MRSGGLLVDIQFGGVRLLLMPSVTPYSCPTLITNRMVLEVLLEHNLLSCQLREEDFLNLSLRGFCQLVKK